MSLRSFEFACVQWGGPRRRGVHSSLRGFTGAGLVVVRVRVGSLLRAYGSLRSFEFTWVQWGRPRRRGVHSGSRVFTCALLNVAVAWIHSVSVKGRLVYSG